MQGLLDSTCPLNGRIMHVRGPLSMSVTCKCAGKLECASHANVWVTEHERHAWGRITGCCPAKQKPCVGKRQNGGNWSCVCSLS